MTDASEHALGCEILEHASATRTCSDAGTKIGLPELQLGIIPGFGGTQRLPRLVGLQQALMMMLTSSPVKANVALGAGLVDAVVPAPQLLSKAKMMALDMANFKAPRKITINDTTKIEGLGEAQPIIEFARAEAVKRAGAATRHLLWSNWHEIVLVQVRQLHGHQLHHYV